MPKQIIFRTVHGSHLYGLAHAKSDYDTYEVFIGTPDGEKTARWGMDSQRTKEYAKQSVDAQKNDVTSVHLSRFLDMLSLGTPLATEALFSPYAEIADEYKAFFSALRVSSREARISYRDIILSFAFDLGGRRTKSFNTPENHFKCARHALRLALNLNDLVRSGQFSPVLTEDQKSYVNMIASQHSTKTFEKHLKTLLLLAENGEATTTK